MNRLLVPYLAEAVRLHERGTCTCAGGTCGVRLQVPSMGFILTPNNRSISNIRSTGCCYDTPSTTQSNKNNNKMVIMTQGHTNYPDSIRTVRICTICAISAGFRRGAQVPLSIMFLLVSVRPWIQRRHRHRHEARRRLSHGTL